MMRLVKEDKARTSQLPAAPLGEGRRTLMVLLEKNEARVGVGWSKNGLSLNRRFQPISAASGIRIVSCYSASFIASLIHCQLFGVS